MGQGDEMTTTLIPTFNKHSFNFFV